MTVYSVKNMVCSVKCSGVLNVQSIKICSVVTWSVVTWSAELNAAKSNRAKRENLYNLRQAVGKQSDKKKKEFYHNITSFPSTQVHRGHNRNRTTDVPTTRFHNAHKTEVSKPSYG